MACCNIVIDCVSLARLHNLDRTMEPQEKFIYFPPGMLGSLFVARWPNTWNTQGILCSLGESVTK